MPTRQHSRPTTRSRRGSRTSRPRRSASSTCTCPARRRTSTCSTTSRSWSSTTARTARTSSSRASGSPSPPACRSCSAPRSRSRSTARPASGCPTRSRRCTRSPTTCSVIRSMNTDQFNHAPAELLLYTGFAAARAGRPWARGSRYGLGTENAEPARLRRADLQRRAAQRRQELLGQRLPAVASTRACSAGRKGDPVLYALRPARAWTATLRRHEPRRPARPERAAGEGTRPPRDADAHRAVRAGLPHADCPRPR